MRAWWIAPLGLGLVLMAAGCGEDTSQRTATGGLMGVGIGAGVGGPIGAIVGGAIGAVGGATRPTGDRVVNTGAVKAQAAATGAMNAVSNTTASAATPGAPSEASAARRRVSRGDMRDAQQRLAHLGLYKGPIDGKFGPQTAAALNDFQAENHLPRTGELTRQTRQQLQAQTAQVPSNNQSGAAPSNEPNNQPGAAPGGANTNTNENPNPPNNPPPGQPTQ